VFNRGVRACRNVFRKMYNKCDAVLPAVIDLVCHIINVGFLCNIIKCKYQVNIQ